MPRYGQDLCLNMMYRALLLLILMFQLLLASCSSQIQ